MKRTCKQCGKEFELSESEISFYKSKGLELPKRCKECREKNKGQNSQTKQKQKMVSPSQSSQNNQNHHEDNNKNDKSRVVISAVAVLLVLLIFVIKSIFAVPSENTLVSDDVVSADIQSKQEVPEKALSEVPVKETTLAAETATSEQKQAADAESETKEQPKEQISQQADVQTQPEIQNETPDEIEIAVATATIETVPETPDAAYRFRKPEYLTEHFQKHGAEFPYATEEEYLLGANNVIQNPNALHKFEAEDGDDVYYVEDTREFVIVSTDGYIRTYFTADLDYYNRQ